jgi:hypothetical protein
MSKSSSQSFSRELSFTPSQYDVRDGTQRVSVLVVRGYGERHQVGLFNHSVNDALGFSLPETSEPVEFANAFIDAYAAPVESFDRLVRGGYASAVVAQYDAHPSQPAAAAAKEAFQPHLVEDSSVRFARKLSTGTTITGAVYTADDGVVRLALYNDRARNAIGWRMPAGAGMAQALAALHLMVDGLDDVAVSDWVGQAVEQYRIERDRVAGNALEAAMHAQLGVDDTVPDSLGALLRELQDSLGQPN